MDTSLKWVVSSFDNLTKVELYALLKLRVEVFVVEQECAYNEIDGQDHLASTLHYLAYKGSELCCYARRLAPAKNSEAVRIGRVVVAQSHRGSGLATELLQKVINDIIAASAEQVIELSAQTSAIKLYLQLGFVAVSEPYLDDGIEHVDMQRAASG